VASPTARSLAHARDLGYEAGVVERRNPRSFVTHDLFGFVDIVAARAGDLLLIQATSGDNAASRRAKILQSPALERVAFSGAKIEVWSWAKRGAHGKRKLWTLRRERLTVENDDWAWVEFVEPFEIPF
jgi:hypothetical protein